MAGQQTEAVPQQQNTKRSAETEPETTPAAKRPTEEPPQKQQDAQPMKGVTHVSNCC